jgi:hypothetical protein
MLRIAKSEIEELKQALKFVEIQLAKAKSRNESCSELADNALNEADVHKTISNELRQQNSTY